MEKVAKHIIFTGRVQGIGFRFTAMDIANRYGLTGMIRNLPNGTVEMIGQGHPEDVAECIKRIEQSFAGYIAETKIEEVAFDPQYKDFKITF